MTAERATSPAEIAPGVHWITVGKGYMRANVYFVRSGSSWVLIDAGSPGCGPSIREAAESLFGAGTPPVSILITHDHPDHTGAVRELVATWKCPVWVHPDELVVVTGDMASLREFGHPLDRWVILPALRLSGKKRAEAIVAGANLGDVVGAFDRTAAPPGLPDWEAVHTAGHTPGHVAFFRRADRVLLSGDALLTIDVGSPWGFLKGQTIAGPPWYVTWDREAARRAVATMADLEPLVVAGGHGVPMAGSQISQKLRSLAAGRRR